MMRRASGITAAFLILAAQLRLAGQAACPGAPVPEAAPAAPTDTIRITIREDDPASPQAVYWQHRIDSLGALDPVAMADSARARGDLRLLSLEGYVTTVPGVCPEDMNGYLARLGAVSLGFFEILEGNTHARFGELAHAYAIAYNRTLLHALGLRAE